MNKKRIPAYDESMKMIICFLQVHKLESSFFVQIKRIWKWRYTVKKRLIFEEASETTEKAYKEPGVIKKDYMNNNKLVECIYVEDFQEVICRHLIISKFFNGLISIKKKHFLKSFPETYKIHYATRIEEYPQEIYEICFHRFMQDIAFQKKTVIGIIDGDVLDYKIWVKSIRQYLKRINCMLIVTEKKECFTELCDDAWEEQGLAITLAKSKMELTFCDYVLDCSSKEFGEKVIYRKPCSYLLLSDERRKRRQLYKRNPSVQIKVCSDFAQKHA